MLLLRTSKCGKKPGKRDNQHSKSLLITNMDVDNDVTEFENKDGITTYQTAI